MRRESSLETPMIYWSFANKIRIDVVVWVLLPDCIIFSKQMPLQVATGLYQRIPPRNLDEPGLRANSSLVPSFSSTRAFVCLPVSNRPPFQIKWQVIT
jgi:hypothetical protein